MGAPPEIIPKLTPGIRSSQPRSYIPKVEHDQSIIKTTSKNFPNRTRTELEIRATSKYGGGSRPECLDFDRQEVGMPDPKLAQRSADWRHEVQSRAGVPSAVRESGVR